MIGRSRRNSKHGSGRCARLLQVGASQIEVAFDDGVIVAGERSWPVTEIELELKSGEALDLYELGGRLAETLPVKLDVTSKSARAFALTSNETPASVKTTPLRFPPNAMLDDAVAVVLASTLNHFVLNWAALREGDHPESIHQMRVALRRLRAALAMFKRALPCPEFDVFRAEAKRIATALGPARECDAFHNLVQDGPMAHFGAKGQFWAVAASSRRATRHRLRRSAHVDRRAGNDGLCHQDARFFGAPRLAQHLVRRRAGAADRASRGLRRRRCPRTPARPRGEAGQKAGDLARRGASRSAHRAENLRYAAEFFGGFFANSKAVHTYVRSTARLQGFVGAHNDAASAQNFLNAAEDADAARWRPVSSPAGMGAPPPSPMRGLNYAWKAFKQAKHFWE